MEDQWTDQPKASHECRCCCCRPMRTTCWCCPSTVSIPSRSPQHRQQGNFKVNQKSRERSSHSIFAWKSTQSVWILPDWLEFDQLAGQAYTLLSATVTQRADFASLIRWLSLCRSRHSLKIEQLFDWPNWSDTRVDSSKGTPVPISYLGAVFSRTRHKHCVVANLHSSCIRQQQQSSCYLTISFSLSVHLTWLPNYLSISSDVTNAQLQSASSSSAAAAF